MSFLHFKFHANYQCLDLGSVSVIKNSVAQTSTRKLIEDTTHSCEMKGSHFV